MVRRTSEGRDAPAPPRTFSVEEVGEIIRKASAAEREAPAAPTAPAVSDHGRITWDELKEIAADVGVSEGSLERVVEAREAAARAEAQPEAAQAGALVPAAPAPAAGTTLWRDVGVAAGVMTVAGGLDVAVGTHGLLFAGAAVLSVVGVAGRAVWRPLERTFRQLVSGGEGGADADHAYRIVFSNGVVDLTHLGRAETPDVVHVDVRFGDAELLIDPAVPYRLETSVLFGEVRSPREGRRRRPASPLAEGPIRLVVRLHVRFGNVKVRLVPRDGSGSPLASILPWLRS